MCSNFENHLLQFTRALEAKEIEGNSIIVEWLWKISRYKLYGAAYASVVVKSISLNQISEHPRGWNTDKSHMRKVKSYEVENYWYEKWNQRCNMDCKTPDFIGSYSEGKDTWIILEDLDKEYPLRKNGLKYSEVKACLNWLANFHATFLNVEPDGLWKVGTYWHLTTRPDELEKLENLELKSKAHLIDDRLNYCQFKTIVHGDAKLANFCFSEDGKEVAAVDFQYVGGGCGMKDVAYFLGSCLSSDECEKYETELIAFYFSELENALKKNRSEVNFQALQREWEKMYPLACADFTRFMLGWMPSHQKVNRYNLDILDEVLGDL